MESYKKKILEKFLGWPKNKIILDKSFRYRKISKLNFSNNIYFSYYIGDPLKTFNQIKYLFNEILKTNLPFKVINHPLMKNSSSHKKLLNLIKNFFKNSNKLMQNNRETIVVGVSAIILEILENGKDVFHICNNPLFEAHSNKIWNKINVKEFKPGIYHYSLKQNGTIIRFGYKNFFKKKFNI